MIDQDQIRDLVGFVLIDHKQDQKHEWSGYWVDQKQDQKQVSQVGIDQSPKIQQALPGIDSAQTQSRRKNQQLRLAREGLGEAGERRPSFLCTNCRYPALLRAWGFKKYIVKGYIF